MPSRRVEQLEGKQLEAVADIMAEAGPNSSLDQLCRSEFLLRQTQLLQRSAEASERAARAALATARHTKRYTKYMLWSVLVLLISVIISVVIGGLQIWKELH